MLFRETSTVLIADDSPLICRFVEDTLKEVRYEVIVAHDDESAFSLRSQNSQKIDVVLSDVMMLGIDGMKLMAKVHELYPDTPVVPMTAFPR